MGIGNHYNFLNKYEEIIPEDGFGFIKLYETYRAKEPQAGGTEVAVEMHVNGMTEIDVAKMTVGLEIRLRLEWDDSRVIAEEFACGDTAAFKTSVLR